MESLNPMSVFDIDQDNSSQELCRKSLRQCRLELEGAHTKLSSTTSHGQPWPTSVYSNRVVNEDGCHDSSETMDVDQQIGDEMFEAASEGDVNMGEAYTCVQKTENAEMLPPNTHTVQNHNMSECKSSSITPATDVNKTDSINDTLKIQHQKLELVRNKTADEEQSDIFKVLHAPETSKLTSIVDKMKSVNIEKDAATIDRGTCKSEAETSKQQSLPHNNNKPFKPGRVAYVYSEELLQKCDALEKIPERASMVHGLVDAYGLLKYVRLTAPSPASEESVLQFHSSEYIEFLQKINDQDDEEIYDEEAAQFGLTYDCPVHHGIYDYATLVAGATICVAEQLINGHSEVAINWFGGWHHAQKDSASGFCYINDIVLGILKLKEKYSRVLYVDLDLHHGDGVENAFSATSSVMTVSFHKHAAGFFPGSGSIEDVGLGKGKFYTVNVPLCDGIRDREFVALFCRVIQKVQETFKPEAVVCQCGADGLAGDPMESFNLTHMALARCVYVILNWKLPTLLLGGGGYHHSNTARCWTFLTSVAIGRKLPIEVPEHKYFIEYGPDYEINVTPGNRKDDNTREHIRNVYRTVIDNLGKIAR